VHTDTVGGKQLWIQSHKYSERMNQSINPKIYGFFLEQAKYYVKKCGIARNNQVYFFFPINLF